MSARGLPPPPINVPLRGFLDFFGIKNGGQNPRTVTPDLFPMMDMQRWYMEGRVRQYFSIPTALAVATAADYFEITSTGPENISNGVSLVVPAGETWLLLPGTRVGCSFDALANQSCEVHLVARDPSSNSAAFLPMRPRDGFGVSSAGVVRSGNRTLAEPYWMGPGTIISGYQFGTEVGAGTVALGLTLRLVRLSS